MAEIHAPVPLYASQIATASDRFLSALVPGRIAGRFNWSLHDSPELFRPDSPPMWTNSDDFRCNIGDVTWVRIERQTLRRLPESGDILFTIRTYVRPLKEFAATPESAASIAESLRQWPAAVIGYKGCADVINPVLGWLDEIASDL